MSASISGCHLPPGRARRAAIDARAQRPGAGCARPGRGHRAYGTGGTAPRVVRVIAHSGGSHWADAGIAAGASIVLLGIGLAGMRAATNSRKRDNRQQRAIATH